MSTLKVSFSNKSGIAPDKVYIGFFGSQLDGTVNGSPMQPLGEMWYSLSEIKSMVLNSVTSGRLYVAYQDTFSLVNGDGLPSVVAPNSPAYRKRFDKFELTFDGSPFGVADLTAIDYWSVPMGLETQKDGKRVNALAGVKAGHTEQGIYQGLKALSDPVQSLSTGKAIIAAFKAAGHPLAPGIQEELKHPAAGLVTTAEGDFVRILGPNIYPPFGQPAQNQPPGLPFTPYNTFLEYFQYLIKTFGPGTQIKPPFTSLGNGKIAQIQGHFAGSKAGSGPAFEAQDYTLAASIDDDFTLTLAGSGTKVGPITMTISKWDLLAPSSSYGGNPSFSLNGGGRETPQNDVHAWILGDFFSGLNIGAIGSAVEVGGRVVGEMQSSKWFSKLPPAGKLFDALWDAGVTNRWNQWAQVLNPRSDAYNFAYAERFSAPQLSLNPAQVDSLVVHLLDAQVTA